MSFTLPLLSIMKQNWQDFYIRVNIFSIGSEDSVFTSGHLRAVPTKFHPYQFGSCTNKYNISYEITVKNSTNSGPTVFQIYKFAKYIFDYYYLYYYLCLLLTKSQYLIKITTKNEVPSEALYD